MLVLSEFFIKMKYISFFDFKEFNKFIKMNLLSYEQLNH